IAGPIAVIPESPTALREIPAARVSTATVDGESFPALLVRKDANEISLYDLTVPPPVLRHFPPATVSLQDGTTCRHSSAVAAYQDPQLENVLAFLRNAVRPQK